MAGSSVGQLDPEDIQYLLDPDEEYDYHFLVGKKELVSVEKIGVVRKMLAAHSQVFRAQLRHSQLKPEHIDDMFPHTFRNLLRFVYGYDTTPTMDFDDADNLLYAANKYMMAKLKNRLAVRLIQLVDYSNICILLNNPACYEVLELKSEMTKILQGETDKVLASPHFLGCCSDAFIKILEQQCLNVPELEVWRAAVKWAKSKVIDKDIKEPRELLKHPLKHIRLCTLPYSDFCNEVVSTKILYDKEVAAVRKFLKTKKKPRALPALCDILDLRGLAVVKSENSEEQDICILGPNYKRSKLIREASFIFSTNDLSMVITKIRCVSDDDHKVLNRMTVKIRQLGCSDWVSSRSQGLKNSDGGAFDLPVEEVVLKPNTKYMISVISDRDFFVWKHKYPILTRKQLTVEFTIPDGDGYLTPGSYIFYRTIPPR